MIPLGAPTDEQLLSDYLQGQPEKFELLVRRYAQELFHFLYRLLGSAAAAEDAVQETFLQLHLSAASFDHRRRLRPWIFTIAANKARDAMRSRRRRPETPLDAGGACDGDEGRGLADWLSSEPASVSLAMESEERSFMIRRMIERLPVHLREVLILGYYHGFAYKEMAEIIQVPLGTIKSRLHAAVAALAKLHGAESDPAQRSESGSA